MAKIAEIDQAAWDEWIDSRPPVIQELCRLYPPDRLYRLSPTGQLVTIASYSEDGTVRVDVSGEHNFLLFERSVFGIDPKDLEECDLPDDDGPKGALLTDEDQIRAAFTGVFDDKHDLQ